MPVPRPSLFPYTILVLFDSVPLLFAMPGSGEGGRDSEWKKLILFIVFLPYPSSNKYMWSP